MKGGRYDANRHNATVPKKRCAIYTRKSTDEGLDQEYNSLEAQRDAGMAYVTSQRHEGWIAIHDAYDDGGFSGGNIKRPALKRLMHDIEANQIDIVVVYKIDRLTRSLPDFAKLVEVFDRHNVSFVSVTQQFNTTNSMGRLTLNILLSFAQFEREVTSERIRDKIAASKSRGMWMGGMPPLGYDVKDRKLIVNRREAVLVQQIFSRYAEHGSAAKIIRELTAEGYKTKTWQTQKGLLREGRPMHQQFIFKLLRNRIYLGEITHKGTSYPGQHDPIISQNLWSSAHTFVERRKKGPRENITKHAALLSGLLFAADGQRMVHHYTKKPNGRTYRYYLPTLDKRRNAGATDNPKVRRIGPLPAAEIENAVLDVIHAELAQPERIIAVWRASNQLPDGQSLDESEVVVAMGRIASVWQQLFPVEQQRIAKLLIDRIVISEGSLEIKWRDDGWHGIAPQGPSHPFIDEMNSERAAVSQ